MRRFKVIEIDFWNQVDATAEDFEDPYKYQVIDGIDEEEAVEIYCRESDYSSADFCIVNRGHAAVMVQDEDGVISKYEVYAEAEPVYTARKIAR